MGRIKQSFCLGCFHRDGITLDQLVEGAKKIAQYGHVSLIRYD